MNQPIEEKWKERLRDLYLITVPDANDLFTKSITFNWGKFVYEPKEQYTEFYLTTKESIESFIENLLEQERNRLTIKNAGLYRQLFGEMSSDKTFTAKEVWEIMNSYQPLFTREQEEEIKKAIINK